MPPPSQRPLRPSIQVLPQMDDDFDTSALEDGFDTSAMDDAPPPSPVKPARRGQSSTSSQHEAPRSQRESDASMDLGQEALAAFATTPASQPEGLHRTGKIIITFIWGSIMMHHGLQYNDLWILLS